MSNTSLLNSRYMQFERTQWAKLRKKEPQPLSQEEIESLRGINENLSVEEIEEIYLPLTRLINFYVMFNLRRQLALEQFLDKEKRASSYIISIAGSVAVGKSTTARVLQALLRRLPKQYKVDLVTTDGFLLPNSVLQERGLMAKKGFPQSYDMAKLLDFIAVIKSGGKRVTAPLYSHHEYDIVSDEFIVVEQPDILILEGLNVLQSGMNYPHDPHRVFISDFVDFSIFVDADEADLQEWYVERFLKLRNSAFTDPSSYFHHYSQLSEKEATEIAYDIWQNINAQNLQKNILPTRERADLIITKGKNHAAAQVLLKK